MVCSALVWQCRNTSLFLWISQRNGARLQVQGLGVPELHLQTLWGFDSARHHSHIHEGREGLTPFCFFCFVFFYSTDTGLGLGAPALEALPSASRHKRSTHHRLFRYAQPLQELSRAQKNEVTTLPPLFLSYWAIALRPGNGWGQWNSAMARSSF